MSIRSRWLGRRRTRVALLTRARKAYTTSKTKTTAALVRRREAQVRESDRVLARHPAAKKPTQRQKVLTEARRWIGKVESPYGSNRAPWGLTAWQQALGAWLVGQAWCGVFIWRCLKVAGVKGLTYRIAAVRFIEEDAAAGRNGFAKLVPIQHALPGDVVTLFGGAHVEIIEEVHPGYLITIGGNTSPGDSGSQSNGGGCFRRRRPNSAVHRVCRPRYTS